MGAVLTQWIDSVNGLDINEGSLEFGNNKR